MPVRDEVADQVDRAVELRRDRHDPDVRPRRRDDLGRISPPVKLPSITAGAARQSQALERLRAAVVRVDEVALEVRRQHARAAGPRRASGADCRQHRAQRVGSAGDRGRAERGHAVARQPRGDRGDRRRRRRGRRRPSTPWTWTSMKPGTTSGRVQSTVEAVASRTRQRAAATLGDPAVLEHDGARAEDAIGEHDVGAGENDARRCRTAAAIDHRASPMCHWTLRPSSGSARRARGAEQLAVRRRASACAATARPGAENTITPAPSPGGNRRSST